MIENYLLHLLGIFAASFFGAGIAFFFNNLLQNKQRANFEKTQLLALIVNTCTLTDRLLNYKIDMVDTRNKECDLMLDSLEQQKTILAQHPIGNFIVKMENYTFKYLLQAYQTAGLSFDVDIKNHLFISAYDPDIYRLVLIANNIINDTNKVIKDLNEHIIELSKKEVHGYVELSILCSLTKNFLSLIDTSLYFLNMLLPLLTDIGISTKKFKSFPIFSTMDPEKYKSYLPKAGYINGWKKLEEKSIELGKRQKDSYYDYPKRSSH